MLIGLGRHALPMRSQEKPEEVYVWLECFCANLHEASLSEMPMVWYAYCPR